MEISISGDVLTNIWHGIRQSFALAMQRPAYLSKKNAVIYIILSVTLVFAVALADISVQNFFPRFYIYLYMAVFLIASAIGIVYARERFVISDANMPLVLAAIPISITIFYTRVWVVGPAVVVVSGSWPGVTYMVGHFLLVCIFIPIFEEIVTRTLFFIGTARYVGYLPAAIITSVAFAIVHPQWVIAFSISCILCYIAYCGVKKSQNNTNLIARIIFHSIYNIVVISLAFYNGLN